MLTDIDSTTVYSWCRCRFGYGYRDRYKYRYTYTLIWIQICIAYIYVHLCILLKCAHVSFDIYYLPTFPVVPSQIVHDIDVYHVGCYIHARWYVVLDRQIGASSPGMYWNSVLTKGGPTLVCLWLLHSGPFYARWL